MFNAIHLNSIGYVFEFGTVKKVKASATDKKHKVWLKIGNKKWIASKYTVVLTTTKQTAAKKPANLVLNTNQLAQAASSQAPVGSSWRQNAIVALAKAQVGKAYVWGATGPSSFDCSGLVQWVYKTAIGQTVSRTTYTQVEEGVAVPVSTASLQPGDLLFWGDVAAPYHVAIYVGNGQYVSAADEQQGVILATISSYFWPSTARRIL
ncbi:C40 family peptidase [Lactobacillus delbrueckii]|uniref:C40 family peptidase n=1 Tax=Lactobacillus delbrueckii TaxID=1584 RepID=UPI001E57E10B|nr:C40 family peptidase [Lactobacillus delbrueckii subsp. lactis]